jgi:hypothetical protein
MLRDPECYPGIENRHLDGHQTRLVQSRDHDIAENSLFHDNSDLSSEAVLPLQVDLR